MGKIGTLGYPDYTLDACVDIIDEVVRGFRGKISVSSLAKMLAMAERSGAFYMKSASLKDYNLMEGRGELRVTPLGERIVHAFSQEERELAKAEAFLRVELFQRLHERLGSPIVPEDDKFAIFLSEITQASRMDIAKKAVTIRRIYGNGARYLPALDRSPSASEKSLTEAPVKQAEQETARPGTVTLIADDINIRLPLSTGSLAILRTTIDLLEARIRSADESNS
jgi:hypothetical protein